MKPIRLSLKGLNSFNEEQVIDFDALTKHGLFGVFGPTGSGKSSILDGMTLALYGKTSRDSSNFINTQCDRMQVGFEFRINEITYHVVRTYKRTPQGKINATKPTRIEEVRPDENLLLEDQTKEVDKTCFEIIGLKFEDFIRTVVLPQGKFSEFIQLKGKERREMLERLFSLSRYGDDLTRKLQSAIRKEKDKDQVLTGQLKGYEEISYEKLEMLEQTYKETKQTYESSVKESKLAQKTYDESLKIYELILKLKDNEEQLTELLKKSEEMTALKKSCELGRKILTIVPYYNHYMESQKTLETHLKELAVSRELYTESIEKLEKEEIHFKTIETKYNDFMKPYPINHLKLVEGLKLLEIHNQSQEKYKDDKIELENKLSKKLTLDDLIIIEQKAETSLRSRLNELNESYKSLHVDSKLQQSVDLGYEQEKTLKRITLEIEDIRKSSKISLDKVTQKLNKIETLKDELSQVTEVFSGVSVISQEMYLDQMNELQKKQTAYQNELKARQKIMDQLKQESEKLDALKERKALLMPSYEIYQNEKENAWIVKLQDKLKDGMACPVCGSESHDIKAVHTNFVEDSDLEKTMNDIIINETILIKAVTDLKAESEIKSNALKEMALDHTKMMTELKETYDRHDQLSKEINQLTERIRHEHELLDVEQQQLTHHVKEEERLTLDLDKIKPSLKALYETYKTDNFSELRDSLYEDQRKAKEISIEIEQTQKKMEEKLIDLKKSQSLVEQLTLETKLLEQEQSQIQQQIEINDNKLTQDFGNRRDIDVMLSELLKSHDLLEDQYKTQSELLQKQKQETEVHKDSVSKYETLSNASKLQCDKNKESYNQMLTQYEVSESEILTSKWTEELLTNRMKVIENYHLDKKSLEVLIEDLKKQLNEQEMTEETLKKRKESLDECQSKEQSVHKTLITLEKDIQSLKEQLVTLKTLLDQKKDLEHKLSLLADLDYLFRGKKFVEYVASYQLRYISVEASKRLYDITSGKYGLEVDEQGKFLIRDFGHGGMTRDMTTLSGGESFLVSLSLALSLSSQIQLKGTAPLELFFLDEGFGTLDERFLEIVMSSLEQIHHKDLSIGLISHVESIKNRVPVKLNVLPSIAGERGSRVKVERT
ncbi:MAG: AAA family ATPase [Clostridiales bacterium]|nr:AAA family ATPase [Clostridiales bacterium]